MGSTTRATDSDPSGSDSTSSGTTMPTGSTTVDPPTSSSSGSETGGSSTGEEPFVHRIFVSETQYTGSEVGSLQNADALCTGLADDGGVWLAILNDATTQASDRITVTGPVYNVVGQQVAAGATELWSGDHEQTVGYHETGVTVSSSILAWVGSSSANCLDWTGDAEGDVGQFGAPTSLDRWLDALDSFGRQFNLSLYCISVPA